MALNLPWIVLVTCANTPVMQNSMRTMRSVRSRVHGYTDLLADLWTSPWTYVLITPLLYDLDTTYRNKPTLIVLGGRDVGKVEIECHLSICKSQGICIDKSCHVSHHSCHTRGLHRDQETLQVRVRACKVRSASQGSQRLSRIEIAFVPRTYLHEL